MPSRFHRSLDDLTGLAGFFDEPCVGWNLIVPFDQGRNRTKILDRSLEEFPDASGHGVVMCIDQHLARPAVTGQMNLEDAIRRDRVDVFHRIEAMIMRTDEDIVDIEQDAAVGFFRDRHQEIPFADHVAFEAQIGGNILEGDSTTETILDLPNAFGDVGDDVVRIGQWKQIVELCTRDAGPTQMIRDPTRS